MSELRIGISGWRYAPWRGVFYPNELAQRRELEFAASAFPSIEINGSFYSLQRPQSYQQWYAETPANFVFSIKGSRYITHMLRLRGVETALANFFASGILALREKTGPFLWQFPANFRYDPALLKAFFDLLPRDSEQALALARKHDARMAGRTCLEIVALRGPFEAQARVSKRARRIRRLLDDAGNGLNDSAEVLAARIRTRDDNER